MKKLILAAFVTLIFLAVIACNGGAGSGSTETQSEDQSEAVISASGQDGIVVDNAFYYTHVSGHSQETEKVAFVLFEYEQLETVKYQVAYIACTCRGPQVNYYSVAYVELSKEDGSVTFISYDEDSTGHYIAGMYGDSTHTYEGVPAKELFATFRAEELLGATQEEVNAMEPMHGEVDTYTGATVTPNNAVRMLQGLFEYHNAKYST